ncbi:unnamed protein product [marine sediment metagenome]|uniref:Uncharacterized protein n=1 Tax=marine sediment metagenome TaxID=412755 RepID=X0YQV0_9ZZZZ
MKAFVIIPMTDGNPDIGLPYHGHVFCDRFAGRGAYLISGTGAQLLAIDELPGVIGIVAVTESGELRWPELDGEIGEAVRAKLNTWLANHGWPTIPEGWTYRRVIVAIYRRFNDRFDLNNFDVDDVD